MAETEKAPTIRFVDRLKPIAQAMLTNTSDVALGEVVTISIGRKKRLYQVHMDLICHHSEYFRTAYNGRWRESEEGVVLTDIEPEMFNIFLHWLYTQKYPDSCSELIRIADKCMSGNGPEYREENLLVMKSCVFGDRFGAPRFKQDAHNLFVDLYQVAPFYANVNYAFENLSENDELLRFLVDTHCLYWFPELDDEEEKTLQKQLPNSFLLQVMYRTYEIRKNPAKTVRLDICSYHHHMSNEEREACPHYEGEKAKTQSTQ
jgi:hypothetical protein